MMTTTAACTQDQNTSNATVPRQDATNVTQKPDLTHSGNQHTLHRVVRAVDVIGVPACLVLLAIVRYFVPLILGYVLWHAA